MFQFSLESLQRFIKMICRIILLVLGTFLLAQCSNAYPTPPGSGPVAQKLWNEYLSIFARSVENGRKVFINVKEDLATINKKSDLLKNLAKETDTILNDLMDLKKIDDNSREKFPAEGRLFRKMMVLAQTYLVHDEAVEVLFRNGLDVFLSAFKQYCEEFDTDFTADVQKYIDGLSYSQRRDQSALIDWFDNYKQISDISKRRDKFDEFMTRFSYI